MSKPHESPENKTFRIEGWLPIAFFLGILAIGLIAAMIVPYFVQ
jgi:hypothetical protein